MAKWNFSNAFWTPIAVAAGSTQTANGACFLQGGSSTQYLQTSDITLSGLAAASAVTDMVLSRDSTVGVTAITLGTNGKNAALDPATAALAAAQVAGFSATTMPSASTTLQVLTLGFNTFGGYVRWTAYPGEEIKTVGASASLGELSLSCSSLTGTPGALASSWIYEPS